MEREQAKEIIHILTDLQKQHDPDCGYRNYKYYEKVISNIYNQNKQLQDKLDKIKDYCEEVDEELNSIRYTFENSEFKQILQIIESGSEEQMEKEKLTDTIIEITKKNQEMKEINGMRVSETGAISPLVFKGYGEFIEENSYLPDGTRRSNGNWQKLFGTPEEHENGCNESKYRHYEDYRLIKDGHLEQSRTYLEDEITNVIDAKLKALYGDLFNTQAIIHKLLLEKMEVMPYDHKQ